MQLLSDKEFEEMRENLRELNHTIGLAHLRSMTEGLAQLKNHTLNLRESPLYQKSPADICEMLEELGWYESDILIDRHWSDITFWNNKYDFELHSSFNGFEWTMHLFRGEEL
jgi:hypothetical protein